MYPDADAASLTPERWQRIEALFHAAIQTPEPARGEFLLRSCAGDSHLLTELQRLVSAFDDERRFRPPADAGASQPKGRLGETVGGYKLDAELGHGGMGTVYLAHRTDGEFDQQVALKVVSAHLRTQFFTERFRAERQILAGLNHPNITRLLDGGVSASGDPFLAMEYVDGQTIDRYCDERLLTVPDRVRLFLEVCSAVEYAHRQLVVHRDLKPGNILVTREGTPKLLDFGTAKLLLAAPAESTTTRFHAMTLRYASPEQLRGEPVSTSMDVYSLGVMLYELAVGAWPFGDPNSPVAGLERAVRDIDPAPPHSLITDESARLRSLSRAKLASLLDGDLKHVVAKAMEADPRHRYGSVEQLSADLRRYRAGLPVLAREHTWLYRGARFAQRHRWRLSAGAVLGAGLALSILTAVQQYGREQRRMVQVRNLSQSYLTDILNEVGKLPGSMKARLLIVDRARKNLDQLLPEAPHDPELRRALASAYFQLGEIQGMPFGISLGDTVGALESYRRAESMASQSAATDWESLAVLVQARSEIAQIYARAGRNREAVALLHSALEPARRLWREAPPGFQVDGKPAAMIYVRTNRALGYALLTVANDSDSIPAIQEAIAQLERTVRIGQEVRAAYPGLPDLTGPSHQYVGFALEGLGDRTSRPEYYKEAAAAQRRSSDFWCRLRQENPEPMTQRNCADSLGELSWALHRAGEGAAAVEAASRSLALMEPLSRAEPDSAEAQEDLANAYFHLGAAENTVDQFARAIGDLRKAETQLRPLRKVSGGSSLETTKLYVDIQRELANALLATHNARAAVEALEKAESTGREHGTVGRLVLEDVERQLAKARALPPRAASQ